MSNKHHVYKLENDIKVYTYKNNNWAAVCRLKPSKIYHDPRWLDTFKYIPETKVKTREIKVKGVKRKVATKVPTQPRPRDSYRGSRRNKCYEDLAWRRECTIH